jgi:O-succinylbenzoate synthase
MDGEPSSTHVYAIPMRTRFRGVDRREGLLWRGSSGWAEFSPFWDYDDPICLPWLRAAEEAAYGDWPDPLRSAIPVNVTVPAVGPAHAARIVRDSAGCRTAKVKVAEPGQGFDADLERVEAVRDVLGPAGRVRIDANGAWSVEDAISRVRALARFDLEYVEQPCRSVDELAAVRRAVDVPIAADESIRRATDPMRVARAEAADIAVLKVQPLGGVWACLRIAEQIGLPVVVSSAVETSVGIAAGLALAAALPQLPYACGLATIALLSADVVAEPLVAQDGMLPVVRPEPSKARLAATAADPATAAAWQDRLQRVRALADR